VDDSNFDATPPGEPGQPSADKHTTSRRKRKVQVRHPLAMPFSGQTNGQDMLSIGGRLEPVPVNEADEAQFESDSINRLKQIITLEFLRFVRAYVRTQPKMCCPHCHKEIKDLDVGQQARAAINTLGLLVGKEYVVWDKRTQEGKAGLAEVENLRDQLDRWAKRSVSAKERKSLEAEALVNSIVRTAEDSN